MILYNQNKDDHRKYLKGMATDAALLADKLINKVGNDDIMNCESEVYDDDKFKPFVLAFINHLLCKSAVTLDGFHALHEKILSIEKRLDAAMEMIEIQRTVIDELTETGE